MGSVKYIVVCIASPANPHFKKAEINKSNEVYEQRVLIKRITDFHQLTHKHQ